MDKRQLGTSDLRVSPLCFGGNVFGWTVDDKTSFALLDAFVGSGMNFIDTADVSADGKRVIRVASPRPSLGNG